MNVSFLQELMNTVAEQGRQLLPWALRNGDATADIQELSRALVSVRGEASGVALAHQILTLYRSLPPDGREGYFRFLADSLSPDEERVTAAASAYVANPEPATLSELQQAAESPRQEYFRRLNLAPGATVEIVAMRRDLLKLMRSDPSLAAVDGDLRHLLYSWFNRGFLVVRRIDWQTPAAILEKIIAYEAVHEIQGWEDLRRRLDPADRRCYAFFHPALIDDPLIFVEVALTRDIPETISSVLDEAPKMGQSSEPRTAVFYSISNCQEGLKGISFGNFLIKQVVDELARDQRSLRAFVTLSPIPLFARWLKSQLADDETGLLTPEVRSALAVLDDPDWVNDPAAVGELEETMTVLAARYLAMAKSADGRPVDPVARFHLGNGARLERIDWLANPSPKGLNESHGLMVNYLYEVKEIERNHEAYANEGTVAVSRSVRSLLKTSPKVRPMADAKRLPAPDPVADGETDEIIVPAER